LQGQAYTSQEKETHQNPKKHLKEDKEKVTKRHIKIVTKLADRFQRIAENSQEFHIPQAEKMVNDILELCCLNESQSRKLLDKQHLNVSGDGSKLRAYSKTNGKRICKCQTYSCDCQRFFNSPDASWGYDAYRNCYIFGYNLYQVNNWSTEHKYELPVYLMMVTGSRHDSVPGMFAINRMTQSIGYGLDNGCFDAAHDATDFYRISRDLWDMRPFIPLNNTNEGNTMNLTVSSINEDGVPICQAQHQMYYSGYCKDRDRIKWRCPIKAVKKNQNLKCDFMDVCSPSEYGRVIYTHPKDNPRLYPVIPRTSQKWQDIYDHRTSAERAFKREKNDFRLTSFRTRSKERLLFYSLLTAIAVHIDAWFHQDCQEKEEKSIKG